MGLSARARRFATRPSTPELPGSPVEEPRGIYVSLGYLLNKG